MILSYRRNERKRGKPGFSPRLTRAKNAWKVLSSRRSTSWQQEKLASPSNPWLQLLGLVVVVDALAANFSSVAPFLKGGVVEFASLVELVLEELNLGLVRVETGIGSRSA